MTKPQYFGIAMNRLPLLRSNRGDDHDIVTNCGVVFAMRAPRRNARRQVLAKYRPAVYGDITMLATASAW